MLEQALTSHLPEAAKKRISLVLLIDPELPQFWTSDSCLLRQLVDNLLGNALKHTTSGEISLRASSVRENGTADRLRMRVTDSGPGVDGMESRRLFEAYRQGRGSVEGKGLGLYICKHIVRAMGGQIRCANTGRWGSCFEVILPGVLDRPPTGPVPGATLLGQLHCSLLLEGRQARSVSSILTRLGIPWSPAGTMLSAESDRNLQVLIRTDGAGDQLPAEALPVLRLESRSVASKSLSLPVFESTLGPALLEMALEWLSRRGRQDSVPSLYRSKLPGGRD